MSTVRLALALSFAFALAACGSTNNPPPSGDDTNNPDARIANPPDAPPSGCVNLAGAWAIGGTCGDDECTFTQAGCAITQLNCTSGAHSTSGSITASSFTYTGVSGGGVPATCNGTSNGATMSGTCDLSGIGTCQFNGTHL